jgi:hypothetical protein
MRHPTPVPEGLVLLLSLLPQKPEPPEPAPNLLAAGFAMPASYVDLEPDAAVFAVAHAETHH